LSLPGLRNGTDRDRPSLPRLAIQNPKSKIQNRLYYAFSQDERQKTSIIMVYRCLLFDLDGTLIDSRADLIGSVNLMLAELGLTPLADERIVEFVGEGVRLLVERALSAAYSREPEEAQVNHALEVYRRHYRAHLLDRTRVYPEVEETLEYFAPWQKAVVTNKPYEFTVAVLRGLGLERYFNAILGGDSLPERKPSPEPLIEAARRCGHEPVECLMIGDSRVDIEAGRAAGMKTCGFVGGFRGREELESAGADALIERFSELRSVVHAPGA